MQNRHSSVSCAWRVLACGALAACAQSGAANHEHGPAFANDGSTDATSAEAGGDDAGPEVGPPGGDGASDAADVGVDEGLADAGSDGPPGADAGAPDGSEAASEAGFVAPTCDGVIAPGEYGDASHQMTNTATSQTWYVTWDDTNLYVAIAGATVLEGNVVYLAANPADAGAGLTAGYAYDNTDVTKLPFAAGVVAYAKASYQEARKASGGAWGAADVTAVRICPTGTSASGTAREEVIPWALLGGRPASFGWLGYLAASPSSNPAGYVYGQMPPDDPGGPDAGAETFTKYYVVPDATPGVDGPFAAEL